MSRPVLCLALACLALLALAAPAAAAPPPAGAYECTISGEYFGDLKIKRDGNYERYGKSGRFTNPKGKLVRFTTGIFKGFNGRWYMTTGTGPRRPEIALRNPIDGFTDVYCSK